MTITRSYEIADKAYEAARHATYGRAASTGEFEHVLLEFAAMPGVIDFLKMFLRTEKLVDEHLKSIKPARRKAIRAVFDKVAEGTADASEQAWFGEFVARVDRHRFHRSRKRFLCPHDERLADPDLKIVFGGRTGGSARLLATIPDSCWVSLCHDELPEDWKDRFIATSAWSHLMAVVLARSDYYQIITKALKTDWVQSDIHDTVLFKCGALKRLLNEL